MYVVLANPQLQPKTHCSLVIYLSELSHFMAFSDFLETRWFAADTRYVYKEEEIIPFSFTRYDCIICKEL